MDESKTRAMRNRIATNCQGNRTSINRLREWWLAFSGLRSRLPIWYFLLTVCITLISVLATFKIFCDLEERQAGDRLQRDINILQQLVERQKPTNPRGIIC